MKRYPFSARKHSHDIELAYNTCRARISGDGTDRAEDIARFNRVRDLYLSIVDTSDGKTAWLTGTEYNLANKIIAWAAERRA